jgi:hypothetical protein
MKKLTKRWIGPFLVVTVLTNGCVRLMEVENSRMLKSPVHKDRLKPFYSNPDDFQRRNQHERNAELLWKDRGEGEEEFDPPQMGDTTTQEMTSPQDHGETQATTPLNQPADTEKKIWTEIEKIEKHRRKGGIIEYLVRFLDKSESWAKARDVTPYARDIYWLRRKQEGYKRRKRRGN